MALSRKFNEDQMIINEREHIFNMLGIISTAIFVVVFIIAKLSI